MVGPYRIIDGHCHIYPEKIAAKAVAGTDKFYDTTAAGTGTIADLLEQGTAAGIDHFVVQSVATTPKQVKSINEFIAVSVAEHPDRLTGLGTLHPDSEDQAADVQHLIELGLHGVKLHPDIQNFKIDDYRCLKIYELCEKAGLPILMHTGDNRRDLSNPNRLKPVLEAYTDLIIVGAHFGGWSIWEEAAAELAGYQNLYVDCSSSMPFMQDISKIPALVRAYGTDRVLFGSDYPMWSPAEELKNFLSFDFTEEEYRQMFSENACKVFSIEK